MGRTFKCYVEPTHIGVPSYVYVCNACDVHFATTNNVISTSFQGRHGKAFLISNVINVLVGPPEDRMLMTGLHTVRDLFCVDCGVLVGWKYDAAYEPDQKYKEGKYIIEKVRMKKVAIFDRLDSVAATNAHGAEAGVDHASDEAFMEPMPTTSIYPPVASGVVMLNDEDDSEVDQHPPHYTRHHRRHSQSSSPSHTTTASTHSASSSAAEEGLDSDDNATTSTATVSTSRQRSGSPPRADLREMQRQHQRVVLSRVFRNALLNSSSPSPSAVAAAAIPPPPRTSRDDAVQTSIARRFSSSSGAVVHTSALGGAHSPSPTVVSWPAPQVARRATRPE